MTVIEAPAKINLTLEVLDERPDGYHEISSVVQTIGLYDRLHFSPAPRISFKCDSPEFVAGESLVSRAAAMLKEISGYPGGANIEIEKRIPLVAGLGGDSSDAAAVLGGLNQLWELGLSAERLLELVQQLADPIDQLQGTAQVEASLAPLFAAGELEVGSQLTSAVGAGAVWGQSYISH